MLYLVGLGLGSERDISLRGLEAVKSSDFVFLESYTSLLGTIDWSRVSLGDVDDWENQGVDSSQWMEYQTGFMEAVLKLETLYGKKIQLADRTAIEDAGACVDDFLCLAKDKTVSLLIAGDPLRRLYIPYVVIHNASILTAVGITGLFLYHFGPVLSIPFFTRSWRPTSFYHKFCEIHASGAHVLCLLDIKMKEPTMEELARGKPPRKWLPPRFMTAAEAVSQFLEAESIEKLGVVSEKTFAIAVARLGCEGCQIAAGSFSALKMFSMGPPLHSLIIPHMASLHSVEKEMLRTYLIPNETLM